MSGYANGRRAPNVSQYLANLNTIPTPQEHSAQNEFELGSEGLDFLNTEFFDFDASAFDPNGEFPHPGQRAVGPQQLAAANGVASTAPNYQFSEFQAFPQPSVSESPIAPSDSVPKDLQASYTPQTNPFALAAAGDKRNSSVAQLEPLDDLEDSSRFAAEEDKRRRNTAASARFRVKKKQREQALEKQAKEMTDKVQKLEGKVQQLEMENKWLKGLITEKSDVKGVEDKYRKVVQDREQHDQASTDERTDGVGTEVKDGEDVMA